MNKKQLQILRVVSKNIFLYKISFATFMHLFLKYKIRKFVFLKLFGIEFFQFLINDKLASNLIALFERSSAFIEKYKSY